MKYVLVATFIVCLFIWIATPNLEPRDYLADQNFPNWILDLKKKVPELEARIDSLENWREERDSCACVILPTQKER